MRVGVVVQARNSSTRYPRKMLHAFMGKTALEWVIERCSGINAQYKILATSTDTDDDALAEIAKKMGWDIVRGSVNDVLNRYAKAVEEFELDIVIRVTGDCVLTDYRVVNSALSRFLELKADYFLLTGMIDGFDVEVTTGAAILEADRKAKLPSEREHVTSYIRKKKKTNVVIEPYSDNDLSSVHLSLDYKEDAEVIEGIIKKLGEKSFSYEDVVELLIKEPELINKTKHIVPNEGYRKSLDEDREAIRRMKEKPIRMVKNLSHFKKIERLIPNCSQTFSKSYLQFSVGASPLFVKEGKGCYLTDLDGNKFVDYTMGLGACILGYAFEPVLKEMKKQMKKGSAYTLPHYLEYELAELLTQIIPSAEMARFGKNGSDVTSAAVRLARAYTGRDYVVCCGYHGWQDWYIGTTTRSKGIPEDVKKLTLTFQYNNIESLEKLFKQYRDKISCVIMEPISLNGPEDNFLHKVKDLANRNGALLIFDEVVTGFRLSLGGAQEFFGIAPDITCLGKAMGNGMPISAIVGRKEVMRLLDEIFFSFTFGGETVSIASAIKTIEYMRDNKVIGYIWEQGNKLKNGIEGLIAKKGLEEILSLDCYPVRMILSFKAEDRKGLQMKTFFQQECAKRGVLFSGGFNTSLPHTDEIIKKTLSVYDEVMDILSYSLEYEMLEEMIEGRLLEPVFRKV